MATLQYKTFTEFQQPVVNELCEMHGLSPEQISFDGDALIPIFDYEANSALSVKLTDIKVLDVEIKERTAMQDPATSYAVCTVVLPDGVTRSVEDSASIGEEIAGFKVETRRDAEGLAQNRASRRGIRSVGVNLWNAHKLFKLTGEVAAGQAQHPRAANYREIHLYAAELEYIVDGEDSVFRSYLAGLFDGKTSKDELNDLELHTLLVNLRTNVGMKRRQAPKQAA